MKDFGALLKEHMGNDKTLSILLCEVESTLNDRPFPGGSLPYMGYIGMCRGIGYGF